MKTLSYKDYLQNIQLSLLRIQEYIKEHSKKDFENDIKTKDAVSYCLIQLGRNIKKISSESKNIEDNFPEWLSFLETEGSLADNEIWSFLSDKETIKAFKNLQKIFKNELKIKTNAFLSQHNLREEVDKLGYCFKLLKQAHAVPNDLNKYFLQAKKDYKKTEAEVRKTKTGKFTPLNLIQYINEQKFRSENLNKSELPLDTNYKYPTASKSSLWTVKKK